eukprot:1529348-Pyramimonas_sp.AAC.1
MGRLGPVSAFSAVLGLGAPIGPWNRLGAALGRLRLGGAPDRTILGPPSALGAVLGGLGFSGPSRLRLSRSLLGSSEAVLDS